MSDVKKIRKRNSYKSFLELYEWLRTKPEPKAILVKMYNLLDIYHTFSSETNSIYAQKSVNQVIQDFEEGHLCETCKNKDECGICGEIDNFDEVLGVLAEQNDADIDVVLTAIVVGCAKYEKVTA